MRIKQWVAVATMAVMATAAAPAAAETIYGVTDSDKLVTFDSATPGTVSAPLTITGLTPTETIKGIDFRPATLQLYAYGSLGQLYRIDVVTGAATTIGPPNPSLTSTDFGFDFNPTVDRLRVISDDDKNLRINPATGAVTNDAALAFKAGDANAGKNPVATAAAYTKNAPASATYPSPPSTTLFDIETGNDVLVSQAPVNDGTLNTIGPLGVAVGPVAGFDISSSGDLATDTAYAALRQSDNNPRLYTINLSTGAATLVGALPTADKVKDIAVAPPAIPIFLVLGSGTPQTLSAFRADRPGVMMSNPVNVTGLQTGEQLVGIDTRPAGGVTYGVGSTGRLYTLNPATGAAAAVSPTVFSPALSGTSFGVDFNPGADALRIVSDADQNLAVSPTTGVATGQTALQYAAGDVNSGTNPNVTAAGYTNVAAAATPILFDIDTAKDILATQASPFSAGTLSTVGPLGVAATDTNGFDVVARFQHEFAALQVEGATTSGLYAVNAASTSPMAPATLGPANGAATLVGTIGLATGRLAQGLTAIGTTPPVTPTPTPTPIPSVTPTPKPYYGIPTPTPTATPPPTVKRKRPGLTATVRPKRDRRRPFRFTTRGTLKRPSGVGKSAGCRGRVRVTVKRKGAGKTLSSRLAKVKSSCRFSSKVTFKNRRRFGKSRRARRRGTLVFTIRFGGNARLTSRTIKRTARYG